MLRCLDCDRQYVHVQSCECGSPRFDVVEGIFNLTPHDVTFVLEDGHQVVLQPVGPAPEARLIEQVVRYQILPGGEKVPVVRASFSEPVGLPPRREGVFWIVSRIVAEARPDRDDLLVPHRTVRQGSIIVGCRALSTLAR